MDKGCDQVLLYLGFLQCFDTVGCVTVGYLAYKTFATYSPVVFMEQ